MSKNEISDGWLIINLDEKIVDTNEQPEQEKFVADFEQENFFADFQTNSKWSDPFEFYVPEYQKSVELFCGDQIQHRPSLPPMRRSMQKKNPSFNMSRKERSMFFGGSKDKINSPFLMKNKKNSKRLRKKLREHRNFSASTEETAAVMENDDFQKKLDWDVFMKNINLNETIEPDYHPGIQNEILNAENEKIRKLVIKIKKINANDVNNLKKLRSLRNKLKIHLEFVADLCRSKNIKMVENKVHSAKKNEADAQKNFKKAKSTRKMYKKLQNEYMRELKNTQKFQKLFNLLDKTVEHLEHEEKEKFFEDKAVEVFEYVKNCLDF